MSGTHGSVCLTLRNHQAVFRVVLTFDTPIGSVWVPVAPYPSQHLLWSVLLILVVTVGVKHYLIMVLHCISLVTDTVFCLLICPLYSFFGEICMPFAYFLVYLFIFKISPWISCLLMEFGEFLIFSGYKLRYMLCKYFLLWAVFLFF